MRDATMFPPPTSINARTLMDNLGAREVGDTVEARR